MEVKAFLISFEKSLIEDGFSSESARHHTLKIAKSLKDSDKAKIHAMQSTAPVKRMASSYAAKIKSFNKTEEVVDTESDTVTIARQFSESTATSPDFKTGSLEANTKDDVTVKVRYETSTKTKIQKTEHATTQKIDVVKQKDKKVRLTPEGRSRYLKWSFSSGLSVWAGAALFAAASLFVYILISVLITSLVVILVAFAAIGVVGTLAGLIYGIIKLFSVVPEGIYEIGLALVILAVTMAVGIGLYNLAVRIVPILWKRYTSYVKEKRILLRTKLNKIRTECNG